MKLTLIVFTCLLSLTLVGQNSTKLTSEHFGKSIKFMQAYKLQNSMEEFEAGFSLISPKHPSNKEYLKAMLLKSKIYLTYEQLDSAEFCLLLACNFPTDEAQILVSSKNPATQDELESMVKRTNKRAADNNKSGHHIVLSFIYNILEQHDKMEVEQQKVMDLSQSKNLDLEIAMQLYKIRGRKVNAYISVFKFEKQLEKAKKSDIKEIEYNLAVQKYYLGWFNEAEIIVDKHLKLEPKELDFLFLKMNLYMVRANYEMMKNYEKKILKIDPKAFN